MWLFIVLVGRRVGNGRAGRRWRRGWSIAWVSVKDFGVAVEWCRGSGVVTVSV